MPDVLPEPTPAREPDQRQEFTPHSSNAHMEETRTHMEETPAHIEGTRHSSELPKVSKGVSRRRIVHAHAHWRLPLSRFAILPQQFARFTWIQLQCCLFPGLIFLGLAAAHAIWGNIAMPIARYDALLIYVVIVQVAFVVFKLETWRELLVICAFHLIGLALEIFKTHMGSWSYPDPGVVKLLGVPIFSGFMYASVGSYICQAFRRFDLRINRFHWVVVSLLAVAAYANFYTHHWIPDLRWWIAAGFVIALWPSKIFFTVGRERYWMPAAVSFVLIGTFLWLAENGATFLGAWAYPGQENGWEMVHVGKLGSWSLLISLSFVLVAAVKVWEGRFYSDAHGHVSVQ